MSRSSSKALKRHSRRKFAAESSEGLIAELNEVSDRSLAIIHGALTEDALRIAITKKLIRLSTSDDERIFDGVGPLATFSGKILIGYAIGAIDTRQRSDLERIKDIRNAFAHAVVGLSFEDEAVADVCMQLKTVDVMTLPQQQQTARWRFILSCSILRLLLGGHFKNAYLGKIPICDLIASP